MRIISFGGNWRFDEQKQEYSHRLGEDDVFAYEGESASGKPLYTLVREGNSGASYARLVDDSVDLDGRRDHILECERLLRGEGLDPELAGYLERMIELLK